MKGLPWGPLFDEHHEHFLDTHVLEAEVATLMQDSEVQAKKGIYSYVLTRDEKHLNLRQFKENERRAAYERQRGLCFNGTKCKTPRNADGQMVFDISKMDADHITPWSKGGTTTAENCQMLCIACNRRKGDM